MADADAGSARASTLPPTMRPVVADEQLAAMSTAAKKDYLLGWLCGDNRAPGENQETLGRRMGVSRSTLKSWKADPEFIRSWEDRMRSDAAHPDILGRQLEVLRGKAEGGDLKAIELYWRLVDKLSPTKFELSAAHAADTLTDAELEREILLMADRRGIGAPRAAIEATHTPLDGP